MIQRSHSSTKNVSPQVHSNLSFSRSRFLPLHVWLIHSDAQEGKKNHLGCSLRLDEGMLVRKLFPKEDQGQELRKRDQKKEFLS